MTKLDLTTKIASATGMRQCDVRRVAQLTLDGIVDQLATEGQVELRNFGVFKVRETPARQARNPRTGEKVSVPTKRVVKFKPGRLMKERVQ